jgi:beta-glucosidase
MSVPRTTGQIPIYYNHRIGSGYNSGSDAVSASIFSGGYVDGPADPLYCFGHGLSYTTFALSDMQVSAKEISTDGRLEISCKVKNIGDVEGDEVVQLYTSFTEAHVTRPNKQLSGFCRITMQPEEEKKVVFHLDLAQLGYYNEDMEFVVEPGTMNLMMGTSSQVLPLGDSVQLTGKANSVMGRRAYICPTEVY